ncbi:hypothetical protein ACFSO0_16390 [Brevibacillus sp. GCM10020057]|uniref:hypothetical protein n=1 Tax=Brevibacillus sp. GCM10020057 TaxID=3317327 RepID=UPI00363D5350
MNGLLTLASFLRNCCMSNSYLHSVPSLPVEGEEQIKKALRSKAFDRVRVMAIEPAPLLKNRSWLTSWGIPLAAQLSFHNSREEHCLDVTDRRSISAYADSIIEKGTSQKSIF